MPEGDSIAGDARRIGPVLLGRRITSVGGTAPSVRANSHRVLDATVAGVRTIGKNLIIELSTGFSIRVHLGMSGRWQVAAGSDSVPGSARLLLSTATATVACHGARTTMVDRTPAIDAALGVLGPDLLGDFDEAEFLRRARTRDTRSMAHLLLDQRVVAGIGNVYKSELLFLAGIHPFTPVAEVSDAELADIARLARDLLGVNIGERRSTTGSRAPGMETWVYGRAGRPCRRCGTRIEQEREDERVTYWCPRCQTSRRLGPGSGSGGAPSAAPARRGM